MKVALGFPWRHTEDRAEAFLVTSERLSAAFPFDLIITADSGHTIFNRCASRNLIVETASQYDVVVVCDADSVPEEIPLRDAILSAPDGLMHFPFDEVWYIDWKGMARIKQGCTPSAVVSRIFDKCESEGGAWVCAPETWWRAGGQDERLNNWGCDDRAFLSASRTLVGMPVKHPGVLICLPHQRPGSDEVWIPEEVALMIEYQDAYLQPDKMREIIDARPNLSGSFEGSPEERSPIVRVLQGNLYS